ncbi:MAG: glycosyltransferase, partial [Proteobacteria bacterium]|nr:glycosyltransferase [Pseudomonadota bacterium]
MQTSERKGRLALVMPRLSRYGGAESFAWRLGEALARRGHAVDFICARCEAEPPEGVTPVVVGRFGGLRVIKILWFALMAERARRTGGYDLV